MLYDTKVIAMGTGESHAPTTPGAGRVGRLTVFRLLLNFYNTFNFTNGKALQRTMYPTYYEGKLFNALLSLILSILLRVTIQRLTMITPYGGMYLYYRKCSQLLYVGKPFNALLIFQTSPPHASWFDKQNLGTNWL